MEPLTTLSTWCAAPVRIVGAASSQLTGQIVRLKNSLALPCRILFDPMIRTLHALSLPVSFQDAKIRVLNTSHASCVALLQTELAGTAAPMCYSVARFARLLLGREGIDPQFPQHNGLLVLVAETLPYISRAADERIQQWQPVANAPGATPTWQSDDHHDPVEDDRFMNFDPPADIFLPGALKLTPFAGDTLRLSGKQEICLLLNTCPQDLPLALNANNSTQIAPGVEAFQVETHEGDLLVWISNENPLTKRDTVISLDPREPRTLLPQVVLFAKSSRPIPMPGTASQEICPIRPDPVSHVVVPPATAVSAPEVWPGINVQQIGAGLTDVLHSIDHTVVTFFNQPLNLFGVMASDTPETETISPEEKAAMRMALELQQQNRRTTATTPAPAQPSHRLTWENGKLSFEQHASVTLKDYALPPGELPLNGTQDKPLASATSSGVFNIKLRGDAGSRLYAVSYQPLVVKVILPMALTQEGEPPLEIRKEKDGPFHLAPDDPFFAQFLAKHYAATGRITGSTSRNGDGLIRNGDNIWAPVNSIAYPVRMENGKYYADAHAQTLPAVMTDATRQRYKPLRLPPLELVREANGQWRTNATLEHQQDLIRLLGQRNSYGVTPLAARDTLPPSTLVIAGYKVPFARDVPCYQVVMWPAITDPMGVRDPVPVVWREQPQAVTNRITTETLPGQYVVLSSSNDLATRPSLTGREEMGIVLNYFSNMITNPFETTAMTIRAARGDANAQEILGNALITGNWPLPHTALGWFAKVADITLQFAFGMSPPLSALTNAMHLSMMLGGKVMLNQQLTREESNALGQSIADMRALTEVPTNARGNGAPKPQGMEDFQRVMEQNFIEKQLKTMPEEGFRNLYAHRQSTALWVNDAQIGHPIPVRQFADLYARKMPAGYAPQYFLSDGGKLRLMTPTETRLNARLQKVVQPHAPSNLYRDINDGWLYVRLTDEQGIRIGDIQVIKNDDWYEVPKFDASTGKPLLRVDQGFKLEGTKLVRLSVSELNELQPDANQPYEKIYLSDESDSQLTTAYLPMGSAEQRRSGRKTCRFLKRTRGFIQTEKLIGPDSQRFRLPGGVRVAKKPRVLPPSEINWLIAQNIPEGKGRAEAVRQLLERPLPEEMTRDKVLSYFGLNEKDMINAAKMAAIPDLPDTIKAELAIKLPLLDKFGKARSAEDVAKFTLNEEKYLKDNGISYGSLGKHYGYSARVIVNARVAVNGQLLKLKPEDITWLNSKLPKSAKEDETVDALDVATLAYNEKEELTKRHITRPMLAKYYGFTYSKMKQTIGLVKRENEYKDILKEILPLEGAHIDDVAEMSFQKGGLLSEHKIDESMHARFYGYDLKTLQEAKQRIRPDKYTSYEKNYFNDKIPSAYRQESLEMIQHQIQENYYLPDWPGTPFSILGNYYHKATFKLQAALEPTDLSLDSVQNAVLDGLVKQETAYGNPAPAAPMTTLRAAKIYHNNQRILNDNHIFQRHLVHKYNLDPYQFGHDLLWQQTTPLNSEQRQFLAQFVINANPQSLAKFYLDRFEKPEWPNISVAQLAREKNVLLADVTDAILLGETPGMNKVQSDYLNPLLLENADMTEKDVAKFYLEKRDLPEWPKISLKQLAVRQKLNYGNLHKEKMRLTGKMTPEQVERVRELPNDDTLTANKVAMLYRNNKDQPDWLDITPPQLAQYYGVDPVDLTIAIEALAVKSESIPTGKGAINLLVLDEEGQITAELTSPDGGRNIDNNLPIIRDPKNPRQSLTMKWLGITSYRQLKNKKVWWGELHRHFNDMPYKQMIELKKIMKREMDSIIINENNQGDILENNFEIRNISIENTEGEIINLGQGVFYHGTDIWSKYKVVGAYAGIGEDTPEQIQASLRQLGSHRQASHSWDVAKSKAINGYLSGNILTNINTGKLGDAASIGENNLVAVKYDNQLIFYFPVKDIYPDDQLLIDYGKSYLQDNQVKTEPVEAAPPER